MKTLLLFIAVSLLSINSYSSHFVGGEITWRCLPTGSYIFYMNTYRDCSGLPWVFQNEQISINGSLLPSNGIISIVMKPDSNKFTHARNGDLALECGTSYGSPRSCSTNFGETIQFFPYVSDPIQLTGTPPSSGWAISYTASCCVPNNTTNINASGNTLLRAMMFGSSSVDTCYDSSPLFAELGNNVFCSGQRISFNQKAIVLDGDSLVFSNANNYVGSSANPIQIPYKPGFSVNNPIPGNPLNPNNQAYSIDSKSGDIGFDSFGLGVVLHYATNTKVTSYRNGVKLSEVYRDVRFSIVNCDTLPSGEINTAPELAPPFNNGGVSSYSTTVIAGTLLSMPIIVNDTNNNGIGNGRQEITVVPMGSSFSLDFMNSSLCQDPSDTSCVTLGFAPALDTTQIPAKFSYRGQSSSYLFMNWQTDCNHLTKSGEAKTHYFTIKMKDDHCPHPAQSYKTIAITVTPSTTNCNLITGIQENNTSTLKDRVQLFPNPTAGDFSIHFSNKLEEVEVLVRDINGKLIQQKQHSAQSKLDLSIHGNSGIYLVQITNVLGERVNLKVIKQ
ncbi:MAG: T9SS type A sorting domain-containing protein [Flavobacteriales bacterium]|nr:T9SS type A sorting domain-containing protein [Flavobacteriales bacterium]